jgi:ATP phosphoribosyltransferase
MLRIALPNKGALAERAVQLLGEAGYHCRQRSNELLICDAEHAIDFFFLRPRDIAVYVGRGVLDLGITGRDLALDSEAEVAELLPLAFGRADFRYAVPKESALTLDDLAGLRIASAYPHLVRRDLAQRGIDAQVIRLDGAVEISVQLGVADAIADVVQSGRTLQQTGLKVIGEPILRSEAILIGRTPAIRERAEVEILISRLQGILVAAEYVMVEYDIPRALLDAACRITPGIESPTISPLNKPDWVAIKAMAHRHGINRTMDDLKRMGAKGIIVTEIHACRL